MMTRQGSRFVCAMLVILTITLTSKLAAAEEEYTIIVHPDNPITEIDRDFLRTAFLKKVVKWGHDTTILPIDLSKRFAVRDRFTREVLKKSPAHLKNYWIQKIFSGKGTPPPATNATSGMIAYVLAHPGAVGYLPAGVDPGKAKVVDIK